MYLSKKFHLSFSLVLISLHFFYVGALDAHPDQDKIKRSGDYYWGEAISEQRSEAITLARSELISRIVVVVITETESITIDEIDEFSDDFRNRTRTMSRLELRGLDHIVNERPDGTFHALAFLHKKDYERSLETERERQLDFAREIIDIEKNRGLNHAIPWIYRAYLTSYYFPESIPLIDETGRKTALREYYHRKLDQWASLIRIETGTPEGGWMPDNIVELNIPVNVYAGDEPASLVNIGFDLPGYGKRSTIDGRTRISLDRLPNQPMESFSLRFRAGLEERRDNQDLIRLAGEIGPFYRRNITIDFNPLITYDFTGENVSGNVWSFSSIIRNISTNYVEWDFGDGSYSQDLNPIHTFNSLQPPPRVKLTLNRNPDLVIEKKITSEGLRPVEGDERLVSDKLWGWNVFSGSGSKRVLLQRLVREQDAREINKTLQAQAARLGIQYGNKRHVRSARDSFIVIVDPKNFQVNAFLSPVYEGSRTNLWDNRLVKDLEAEFRNLGMIYIQP